jgi:multidrug efflux system membrane fusion protein
MRRAFLLLLVGLLVIGAAGGSFLLWHVHARAAQKPPPPPATPVTAAAAQARDVPIYLSAIGSVFAYNTVLVHSRVDGQLLAVHFVEGQDVHAGDLLAEIDPLAFEAQLDQARAAKARDAASLANARRDLARFIAIGEYATHQAVDNQRALVAEAEAALKGDDATIESATVQLGYTKITAPIDGRAGISQVSVGNIVHAGDANGIVVISQMQPATALFTLPQDDLAPVADAMARGAVPVDAYTRKGETLFASGTLSLIDNEIDQTTGTMRLKAVFDNPQRRLWPGEFVSLRVLLGIRKNGVTVPGAAVQRDDKGSYVYVIKPDSTVESRPVKLAAQGNDQLMVAQGLQPGDKIVVEGQYRLRPGDRVQVAKAGAATDAGGAAKPPAGN